MIDAVTPYGRQAGSSRVRVFEWLARTGSPSVVHCYLGHRNSSPSYLLRHPAATLTAEAALRETARSRPERLLLHREASPLSRGGLEARLLKKAELAVYDFDDALQWDDGTDRFVRRFAPKAPKTLASVRMADRVIAGNSVLAEWASDHNRDVRMIPSCVSPAAYPQRSRYELNDPPRLGWVGSADNEPVLGLIATALEEVNRRTGARVTLIGASVPRLGRLEKLIDRVPWSEEAEKAALSAVDIGLMPLADDAYSRGKCGYKLLQYGAAAIPSVASPVGVASEIVSRMGMPAVTTVSEWMDAILDLLHRPAAERQRLGQRARVVVGRHYAYEGWLACWEEALGLTSRPTDASSILGQERGTSARDRASPR